MKKKLLISIILASALGICYATTHTITNNGFAFSPTILSINVGDTVVFSLASIHDAIQVNKATWDANLATPLAGGFSLPFGGGKVTSFLTADTVYYVCGPHVSTYQMKGIIVVQGVTDVPEVNNNNPVLNVFPNPASDFIIVSYTLNSASDVNIILINSAGVEVRNLIHESQNVGKYQETYDLNQNLAKGEYFVILNSNNHSYIQKVIVK